MPDIPEVNKSMGIHSVDGNDAHHKTESQECENNENSRNVNEELQSTADSAVKEPEKDTTFCVVNEYPDNTDEEAFFNQDEQETLTGYETEDYQNNHKMLDGSDGREFPFVHGQHKPAEFVKKENAITEKEGDFASSFGSTIESHEDIVEILSVCSESSNDIDSASAISQSLEEKKEDDLVEHSWKESPDSSPFSKAAFIQIVSSAYVKGAVIDGPSNPTRLLLFVFVALKVAALQKLILEIVRMEKERGKSKLIFPIYDDDDEQKLRFTDFSRCNVDDVRNNTYIKFKKNCEIICKIGDDGFHDSPSLLKNQDAASAYSKSIKTLVMSLEYIWINAWTEWYFSDSFKYHRIFNPRLLFASVHRVVARVEFASNEIQPVRDNANNVYDGFDLDDDEDYDADDEMDDEDEGYVEDNDANNDYGIQYENILNEANGIEENVIDEMLFAFPHQEPNNENEDNAGSFVYNKINIGHINSQEVLENDYINVENENIDIEE